jgi:hypothetical protein
MERSSVNKVMWVGRATVFLVGLSVILAVVLGVATMAFAANGDPWRLGRNNVATAITALGGTSGVDGSMVRLTNNNGATNDTALNLNVQSGEPPMTVNSSTKVTNLNADQLDGKDSSQLGLAGFEELDQRFTINANTTFQQFDLPCPTGKQALGGGFGSEAANENLKVKTSYPSGGIGNGWTVVVSNSGTTASFIDRQGYLCRRAVGKCARHLPEEQAVERNLVGAA